MQEASSTTKPHSLCEENLDNSYTRTETVREAGELVEMLNSYLPDHHLVKQAEGVISLGEIIGTSSRTTFEKKQDDYFIQKDENDLTQKMKTS